jgi:hypothetical protein
VPIVQAGENIAFAIANGQVTAHIQIQYQGTASDFGWLLPLPSLPTLELGTDELFAQLIAKTQPKYKLTAIYDGLCSFDPSRGGQVGLGAGNAAGAPPPADTGGGGGPLVFQASIGPYDYAVLKADSKDPMLNWLAANHYFVPAGTADAVGPYIRPNAYFLALKLHSGESTGNLQPVVVHYASDLAMIPLVLTSVAAKPDMGIQVWMLGDGRAIPRNYYHTVINDAKIDWINAGKNYNDVIIAAVNEAPEKHTFVTEYAGGSAVMQQVLDFVGRFGDAATLQAQSTEWDFVNYMLNHGYPLTTQTLGVLAKYIPEPDALVKRGVSPANFYYELSYYLGSYRQQNPSAFAGWTENFQPALIVKDLQDRVVTPTLAAGALFTQFPYLTRLYTTLSPEDMNKDPVFSYNRGLPNWPNEHDGTITYHCGIFGDRGQAYTAATVRTAEGYIIDYPNGTATAQIPPGPSSEQVQVLREDGAPQVVTDNRRAINRALGSGSGCGVGARTPREVAGTLGLMLLVALLLRRRRAA